MAKIFYDHLIIIEEITSILDDHALSQSGRRNLMRFIDQTFHHHILDTILTNLPDQYHETFLMKFHKTPHDPAIMIFLQEHAKKNIEQAILKVVDDVKKEIITMIEASKRK